MKKIALYLLTITAVFAIDIQPKIDICNDEQDYHACNFVGDYYLFKDKDDLSDSYYMKAKTIMESSCLENDLVACSLLGNSYELGSLVYPKSFKKAMIYYNIVIDNNKVSCNNGSDSACFKLGLDYSEKGLLNNPDKAKKYFKKACKLGRKNACGRK